jgi:class 3 adenylate cyclase
MGSVKSSWSVGVKNMTFERDTGSSVRQEATAGGLDHHARPKYGRTDPNTLCAAAKPSLLRGSAGPANLMRAAHALSIGYTRHRGGRAECPSSPSNASSPRSLAADIAGYSRLVGLDEEGTLARLRALRRELIDPTITEHRGRIFKTTGDGVLVEFASVVDAVRCAVAAQRATAAREAAVVQERRIEFRVGINLGDIVVEGEDILGDGVNIAARLEAMAAPNGICLSQAAFDQVEGKIAAVFTDLGERQLKNIARPVRVFAIDLLDRPEPQKPTAAIVQLTSSPPRLSIVVLPFANIGGDKSSQDQAPGRFGDRRASCAWPHGLP